MICYWGQETRPHRCAVAQVVECRVHVVRTLPITYRWLQRCLLQGAGNAASLACFLQGTWGDGSPPGGHR